MAMPCNEYKTKFTLEQRKEECKRIRSKYPQRIPVLIEMDKTCKTLPSLDKKKFLIPHDYTIAGILWIIRERIKISDKKSIFIFVGNRLLPATMLLSQAHAENKDEDGYLYITYTEQDAFGN
jgi:GABA(A) receptor-associated protein